MKLLANSDRSLEEAIAELRAAYADKHYLRITATTCRERTIEANALWAAQYQRVSETLSDGSAEDIADVKAYCKLMLGVPILRRDSEQFEKGWRRYFAGRSYEEQIFLMGNNPLFGIDGFPVTRLFDTRQGAEYTESITRHYAPQNVFFGDLLDGSKKAERAKGRKASEKAAS